MANVVAESSPPDSSTTARFIFCFIIFVHFKQYESLLGIFTSALGYRPKAVYATEPAYAPAVGPRQSNLLSREIVTGDGLARKAHLHA